MKTATHVFENLYNKKCREQVVQTTLRNKSPSKKRCGYQDKTSDSNDGNQKQELLKKKMSAIEDYEITPRKKK